MVGSMKYIKGQTHNQMAMVTECLEDYISEESPVRVIDAFVDSLDLDLAGIIRTTPKETGRPPYDPRDLLVKLTLFRDRYPSLKDGQLLGVLDIDSPVTDRFGALDQEN